MDPKQGEFPVRPRSEQPLLMKGIVLNGRWEILDFIARGGKAEIYRARHIHLDREVAIKTISEEFVALFQGEDEELQVEMERFRREAMAMSLVRHPNVLQVYDSDIAVIPLRGKEISIYYIVIEYIEGPTLRSTMLAERLCASETCIREWIQSYFLPILDGVETIHNLGVVHRDLKPENVLLDGFTPKITDFGLAGGPRWKHLTLSHHIVGTLQYMSPEQFLEMGETDVRGDIYALGKILYEVISGKMNKKTSYLFKTARLGNPDTPLLKQLDQIIQQATAEDRDQRMASAKIFKYALVDALEKTKRYRIVIEPKHLREPSPISAIGILLILAAIFIAYFTITHKGNRPAYLIEFIETLALTQIVTGCFLFKYHLWAWRLAIGFIGLNILFFMGLSLSKNSALGVVITLYIGFCALYYSFSPGVRRILS